jgi:general secretion pathway protein A
MYLQFFGLRESPFGPTPDPKFLFQSTRHREALAQLVYGVYERKGFIVLTGDMGTGKTTLLHTLFARLDRDTHVAHIHNSALDTQGLLEYMLQDWGVKSTATTHAQRLFELNEFLADQHRQGRSPILIIDEAQNLSVPTLEAIRMLSNFETSNQKLVQILLVGQTGLRETLARPELRQLKQRIGLRCHIGPLLLEETGQYIRHRMRVAGSSDSGVFTEPAIQRIARYSEGVPRVINIVGDHCLLSGFADGTRRIDVPTVDEAIEYLEDDDRPSRRRSQRMRRSPDAGPGWGLRVAVAILVVLVLVLLVIAINGAGWLGHLLPTKGAP